MSLRDGFCFARQVRGRSALARPRSLRFETPSTATQQHVPGRGPLGVRMKPRHRNPVPVRAPGPRGFGRHGRWHPPGDLKPPPFG